MATPPAGGCATVVGSLTQSWCPPCTRPRCGGSDTRTTSTSPTQPCELGKKWWQNAVRECTHFCSPVGEEGFCHVKKAPRPVKKHPASCRSRSASPAWFFVIFWSLYALVVQVVLRLDGTLWSYVVLKRGKKEEREHLLRTCSSVLFLGALLLPGRYRCWLMLTCDVQ